jgi:predicted chitinase
MVIAMRKATFDEAGENFYKWNKDNLFTGGHEQFTIKTYDKFAEVLNKTFENYDINTCIRKIHFLGQCYHETGSFVKSVEGKKNQEYWYDPYRGRGFIHLTLRGNYQKFKDNSGYDVVNNPTLVSTNIEVAAMSSGWYWKYNDMGNINPFADKDSIFDTSRLVNKPNATKSSSIIGYNQRINAINALKIVFKYPQDCISLGNKEEIKEKTPCASGLKDCICIDKFTVENGFIQHSRVAKNHVSVIEHGNFKDPKTSVQKVILHRTAGGTTQACINAFKGGRKNKKGGIDHYGTHFVVGKDGIITQTANLTKVTWHCAGWNSKSVGIEVVGFAIDKDGKPTLGLKGQNPVAGWENLTKEQAKSVACLVKALYYNLDKSKIDCHEHLAPKEEGEGQIVYNAIKDYL